MDTMEQQVPSMEEQFNTLMTEPAVQSDLTESVPLKKQLEFMKRPALVEKMSGLGYQVDGRVSEKTIRENILKIISEQKSNAKQRNAESLAMAVSKEDPMIEVKFFHLESPETDIEFAYSGTRGMYGPEFTKDGKKYGNPKGFRKCPKYHLFPGETVKLPFSVYEHLERLTYVTNKAVHDPVTGMIGGNIPIIKPRFLLQLVVTKEQVINMNK